MRRGSECTEEVHVPAGREGQRVALVGLCALTHVGDGARRGEYQRGKVGELGGLELRLGNVHVEHGVEKVRVVGQCFLDQRLQLRVGKDASPRQVAEVVASLQRRLVVYGVAHDAVRLHLGTLVVAIEALTSRQREGGETRQEQQATTRHARHIFDCHIVYYYMYPYYIVWEPPAPSSPVVRGSGMATQLFYIGALSTL